MFKVDNENFKKKLLCDYYKLREMINCESDQRKKMEIARDIYAITEILDDHYNIHQDSYNHVEFSDNNSKLFSDLLIETKKTYNETIRKFKKDYKLHKEIISNSKNALLQLKYNKIFDNIQPTDVSKKMFFDVLFDIPNIEYKDFLFKQFQKKNINIIDYETENSQQYGLSYNTISLDNDFHIIETNKKFSYLTMFTVIHETTHSYIDRKYKNDTLLYMYREVLPLFQELKFMDYLKTKQIGKNDCFKFFNAYVESLNVTLKNFCGINIENMELYFYIIGPLLAFYFYELDKIDQELCKNKLEFFCSRMSKYEPIRLLQKTNINIEEFTSGDVANRMVKKYNKERKEFKG